MKKKLFDGKLYLEGLRQTKVLGITIAIITIVFSALFPLYELIEEYQNGPFHNFSSSWQLDLLSFAPLLIMFMFLAPVLLTLQLFSFLNKRNGSDFYHALPCTRNCLFISFCLSIITWLAGTILTTLLVNALLYSLTPGCMFSWSFIPNCFFSYFFGALLVMAIMMLAKSMTGTAFNNIIVALLIMLFPRFLTYMFDFMLTDMAVIIETGSLGIFSDFSYNIPVRFALGNFLIYEEIQLDFIGGMIYTFILAMIYFAIALLLFQKRKSETAQRAATSKWMQHVFRCLVTIPVTFFFFESNSFFSFLVAFLITLLVYFGYELITTKKVKNLLKALPMFFAVLAFDVLFCFSLVVTNNIVLGSVQDPSQIQSVGIDFDGYSYVGDHYNKMLADKHFVDDADLEKMVAEALEETIASIKDGTHSKKLYQSGQYYEYLVSIKKDNGTVLQRNIMFTIDQVTYAKERYEKETAYQEKLVQLPDKKGIDRICVDGVSIENSEELWNCFSREYNALTHEEKCSVNGVLDNSQGMVTVGGEESRISIEVYGFIGTDGFTVNYQIGKTQFPDTYTWCLSFLNKQDMGIIDMFWKEADGGQNSGYGYEIWFSKADVESTEYCCFVGNEDALYWPAETMERYKTIPEDLMLIKTALSRPVSIEKPIYKLTVRKNIKEDDFSYMDVSGCVYFNLTEEEYEVLKEYLPK